MSETNTTRAVVCGAGVGGLAAAAAVAPYFDETVLIDRDVMPDEPRPRPGVPQSSQSHGLLKRGESELEALLPGFCERLEAAGGVRIAIATEFGQFDGGAWHPRVDLGLSAYCQSRVLLEQVVREMVAERFDLTVLEGATAANFRSEEGRVRAVVVETQEGADEIEADLVIDALGRASPVAGWLKAAGWSEPPLDIIGIDLRYATQTFRRDSFGPDETRAYQIAAGAGASAVLLPLEGDRWLATLGGRFGDYPPADADGFLAFARGLPIPEVADIMAAGDPLDDVVSYTIKTALRRRWEEIETPANLVSLGEARIGFDPTFAQGMSVAAAHAGALDAMLKERGGLGTGFSGAFYRRSSEAGDWAWRMVEAVDFTYPGTKGTPPADLKERLRLLKYGRKAAQFDPDAQRLYTEVRHLLRPMSDLSAIAQAA
ncbi:MAG: FAD-dependent oxidoreductase [Pseudomonadota bacterium]